MCGIVGVISKRKNGLFHSDIDIFTDLLFADQLRGAHGTGMFYDVDGVGHAFKGPMPSSSFLRSEKIGPVFNTVVQKSNFLIGHNRHATKGGVSFDSTHPFIEGETVLIHNGTLPSHKHIKDVEVDSHAICHSINEIGHIETLKKIDGAFALVWFDGNTKKLHFIRNTERPLHIVETDDLIVMSSEAGLVEWILKRKLVNKVQPTVSCEVGHLYTYDIHTHLLSNEKVEIKPKSYTGGKFYGANWDAYFPADSTKKRPTTYTPPPVNNTRYHSSYFVDARVGDTIIFSPVDLQQNGKTWVLSGLGDTLIYNTVHVEQIQKEVQLTVRFFNPHEEQLRNLLDYAQCRAQIIQIVWKGNNKSVVVKDVQPVIEGLPVPTPVATVQ